MRVRVRVRVGVRVRVKVRVRVRVGPSAGFLLDEALRGLAWGLG